MAGLLNPESGAALARLGAGLLSGNFAGGLASASEYAAGLPEQKLKRGLLEAQIAETQGQAQERAAKLEALRRQQEFDRQFFGLGGGAASPVTSVAGGPPSPMPSASAPTAGAPAAPGGGFTAQQISAQFGVPIEAVIADYKFNGGKKIAELIDSRSKPNWQNVNGNLVNTNAPGFQGGLQAGVSVGRDGQATMWQPDGRGGLVVGAPQGAFDTFRQYQNIQEGTKALLNAAGRVNLRPNADGTQAPVSELSENPVLQQLLGVQAPGQAPPQGSPNRPVVSPEAQRSADQEAVRMMQAELQNPNLPPDQRAGVQREIARLQQAGAQPGFPAASSIRNQQGYGKTTQQVTQDEVDRQAALDRQKNIGEQRKSIVDAGFVAPTNISRYQQIGRLLQDVDGGKLTPVGTEFASALNSIGIKVDKNLSNKEAAAAFANQAALELRNPQGGAGMPGALSDSDRNFLVSMTPNVAQSAQGRKLVIDAYVAIQNRNMQVAEFVRKYEKKYGKLDNGFFDQLQQWSNANPIFKAQ